jgi:hypothetical protein
MKHLIGSSTLALSGLITGCATPEPPKVVYVPVCDAGCQRAQTIAGLARAKGSDGRLDRGVGALILRMHFNANPVDQAQLDAVLKDEGLAVNKQGERLCLRNRLPNNAVEFICPK